MSKLNQKLLNLELEQNFAYDDFFVSKCKIDIHQKTLGFLLTHIGSPCLIFNALSTTNIDYIILFEIGSAAISVIFISSLLAILVIKLLKESFSPYFSCLIHPNSANLALPLSILTYGEQGLIFAIPYFVVVAFSQNTIGYMTILGSINIFRLFYHPIFVMTFLGAFIMITKINVPEIALTSTKYLGNLVIPLSLILLGYFRLARILASFSAFFLAKRAALASAVACRSAFLFSKAGSPGPG